MVLKPSLVHPYSPVAARLASAFVAWPFRHRRKEVSLLAQSFAEGLWASRAAAAHLTEPGILNHLPLWYQRCTYQARYL